MQTSAAPQTGTVQVLNPQTKSLTPIQTTMVRDLEATGIADNGALLLKQTVTFKEASKGVPLSAVNAALAALDSSETYALDRATRANMAGGDKERTGQYTFPAGVEKKNYDFWSSSTNSILPAQFVSEETVQGLKAYVFKVEAKNLPAGTDETTKAPQTMDTTTTIWVEPVSGVVVDTTSKTTITLQIPGSPLPKMINEVSFADDTVAAMADYASATRTKILWAGTYGVYGALGLGLILVLVGLFWKKSAKAA